MVMNEQTMDDVYEDASDHICCIKCGFCKDCGDCEKFGCGSEVDESEC